MTSEKYMAMLEELVAEEERPAAEAPAIVAEPAITNYEELPELPPELIEGVIRKGGKLLIAGASKAGKSYLLIELAVAVATGGWWLDRFKCMRGRVLYVNLEIQKPQFMHRVCRVTEAAGADRALVRENLMVANLRGKYTDAATLVDDLVSSYGKGAFDLVIIDPAYKVQPGSENDADAITRFCAELDRLVDELDCTSPTPTATPRAGRAERTPRTGRPARACSAGTPTRSSTWWSSASTRTPSWPRG